MAKFSVPFTFECRFCERGATITEAGYEHFQDVPEELTDATHGNLTGSKPREFGFETHFVRCPNPRCHRVSVRLDLVMNTLISMATAVLLSGTGRAGLAGAREEWITFATRWIIPDSAARVLPDYVPAPIREDYVEACRIEELSPKAAATLARRAIQGMIRDVFKITERTLFDEIGALEENPKVDPDTWNALDGVRQTGNVGAHMKENINEIVEVDPTEVRALIQLIEMLVESWYIMPQKRKELLKQVKSIGDGKADAMGKPKREHPLTSPSESD